MRSSGPNQTEFEARGIASNGGNSPTVGFLPGDIPLSPPAMGQIGKVVIDPNLYDLDRVEVLRGPQGTLYGASSMGGTIKLIPNAPQLNTITGSTDGTLSHTDGGRANGGADFMVNYSTSDYWAVRAVGSYDYRSGWISRTVVSPFPADVLAPDGPPYTRGNVAGTPATQIIPDVNDARMLFRARGIAHTAERCVAYQPARAQPALDPGRLRRVRFAARTRVHDALSAVPDR